MQNWRAAYESYMSSTILMFALGLINLGIPLGTMGGDVYPLISIVFLIVGLVTILFTLRLRHNMFQRLVIGDRRAILKNYKLPAIIWIIPAVTVGIVMALTIVSGISRLHMLSFAAATLVITMGIITLLYCRKLKARNSGLSG